MTNSQESDSIAEKPEVVKTEAKSNRWNWKTATIAVATACALTIAGLFAINPKILNAAEPPPITTQPVTPPGQKIRKGNWFLYIATLIGLYADSITIANKHTGEVDRVDVENNRPIDKDVTIISADRSYSAEISRSTSGVYEHGAYGDDTYTDNNAYENAGNYAKFETYFYHYVWDEDEEAYVCLENSSRTASGPEWQSRENWDNALSAVWAVQINPDYDPNDDVDDHWLSRAGIWITSGYSIKYDYGDFEITFQPRTPTAERLWAVDASLAEAAKKANLRYTAKIWYDWRKVGWIPGKNGFDHQGARAGKWSFGIWNENEPMAISGIPSWETYEASRTICEENMQVDGERVYGGMDVKWHDNVYNETLTISRVPSNNPNATPVVQNNVPFRRIEWVADGTPMSNNYKDWEKE